MSTGRDSYQELSAGRGMSKSSFARGRISQVIASARYEQHPTLNEPTRPVTPAALDMRTSLHGISLDAIRIPTDAKKKKATSSRSRRATSNDSAPTEGTKTTNKNEDNNIYIPLNEKEEDLDFFGEDAVDASEGTITGDLEALTSLYHDLQFFCGEIKKATSGMSLLYLSSTVELVSAGLGTALKRLKLDSSVYQDYKLQNLSQPLAEVISGINLFCSEATWLNSLNATILRLSSQLAAIEDFSLYEKSRILKNMEVLLEFIYSGRTNSNGGGIDESVDLSLSQLPSDNDEAAVVIVPAVLECIQFTLSRLQMVFRVHAESFEGQRQIKLTLNHCTASSLNITAYCTAILRLLSQTEVDRRRLVRVQGLQTISTVMDFFKQHADLLRKITILNEDSSSPVQSGAVAPLVQVVGIIRNLSLDKTCRQALSNSPTISTTMCSFLRTYVEYPEVILNITRVLAKLSLYEWFRSQVGENLDALVYVLRREGQRCQQVMNGQQHDGDSKDDDNDNSGAWPEWYTWPLISRMAFALGNFTTTNENNRRLIGITHGGADSVVTLFQVSVSAMMRVHEIKMEQRKAEQETGIFMFAKAAANPYVSLDEEDGGKASGVEEVDQAAEQELRDAIIKLVRLMANLSIDSEVGLDMGRDRENLQSLHDLLTICDSSSNQAQQQSSEQEEMQLNVIAALTNLTFYSCQQLDTLTAPSMSAAPADAAAQHKKEAVRLEKLLATIAVSVSDGLFHENTEIVLETGRVLGNLTRRPLVITTLVKRRIDEALLMLLTHINTEVIAAIAGVFVNFSACQEGRLALLQRTQPVVIVPHLSSMLRRLQLKDVQIAMLFTQILYNLITAVEYSAISTENISGWQPQLLLDTLEEWLDLVSEEDDQRGPNQMQTMFIQVAQALQQHLFSKQREVMGVRK